MGSNNGTTPVIEVIREMDPDLAAMMERPIFYKLAEDGRTPIPATVEEAGPLLSDYDARRVDYTVVGRSGHVSTVFLVCDHGFQGEPVLFETMVFGGPMDGQEWRSKSWAKAYRVHQQVVRLLMQTARPMTKKILSYQLQKGLGLGMASR